MTAPALAAAINGVAELIDRELADESASRQRILEDVAGRLRMLASGELPVTYAVLDPRMRKTVLQALQDAAYWRSRFEPSAGCSQCTWSALCAEHHGANVTAADEYQQLARVLGGETR